MDSIDFGYSIKNYPTHSKSSYLYKLIDKVEKHYFLTEIKQTQIQMSGAMHNTSP